jgi:Rod binding domain-containing protein
MISVDAISATTAVTAETNTATPQPRLVRAAHEFEAQMMAELLKPLSSSNGLDGEDDDAASGSGSALGEFASEALGRGLSEHGGFGIANSIVSELTPKGNTPKAPQVTGNLHVNTVINSTE